jgi:hypothetical protein
MEEEGVQTTSIRVITCHRGLLLLLSQRGAKKVIDRESLT